MMVLDPSFESAGPSHLVKAASTNGEVCSLKTSSRTSDCGATAFSENNSRDGVDTGLTCISFGTLAGVGSPDCEGIRPWSVELVPRLRVDLDMMFKPVLRLFSALFCFHTCIFFMMKDAT